MKIGHEIFELGRDFIGTKLLTMFHEDGTRNVASRVFTSKSISGHAFLPIRTIFELNCHIQKTHVLTKFHEHWTKNVPSRVFPCRKLPRPLVAMFFHRSGPFFNLSINETNVLTNFYDDWAKIVTSRVFTRKLPRPLAAIFELGRDLIGAKLLTKFYEDGTRNVASRVFRSKCLRTDKRRQRPDDWQMNVANKALTRNTALPFGGHALNWYYGHFSLLN
ncbi:hypothetical protein DPMN_037515 [Dreissena polymorpha]|uniref:Uncharacterized protein n=1 Tax=Dreissena polymorpha TaxID=45954 RepID=A0A9D4RP88_DREPO|nr:hypothetical protein DPMN_037515 [Dreissena polymorpha]